MGDQGTRVKIVSKHGFSYNSLLSVEISQDNLCVNWRVYPQKLGIEMIYLKDITKSESFDCRINLVFQDEFELEMEFDDYETTEALFTCLESLQTEAKMILKEKEAHQQMETNQSTIKKQISVLQEADYHIITRQELLYQLISSLKLKEGRLVIERLVMKKMSNYVKDAFSVWTNYVKMSNDTKMKGDKAWYHTLFFNEVYRLRGPFWYKDAVLPVYRTTYDVVDNALTPLEESALAHVLCSPDTVYGDVAGQMFVVQALTTAAQFQLFQNLASHGATVVKYPRTGRPAKKLFRFSFVEGKIYLTWMGKFGNQGVDLGEVSHIANGSGTDLHKNQSQLFLSLICAGRSVDLCFETEKDRDSWKHLLEILSEKEHLILRDIERITPNYIENSSRITRGVKNINFFTEWIILYDAIGVSIVPEEVINDILELDCGDVKYGDVQAEVDVETSIGAYAL